MILLLLCVTIFICLQVAVVFIAFPVNSLWDIVFLLFIEWIVFTLSYDWSEFLLSLILRPKRILKLDHLTTGPRVGLLYLTCDDFSQDSFASLLRQTYKNTKVFILDDSQSSVYRQRIDRLSVDVVRRQTREGYKAGNLNNWLRVYGREFAYFVICDADTVLPENTVEALIHYAEHKANSQVAIFETIIRPHNNINFFAESQGTVSCLSEKVKLNVENNFGMTLSTGHNNLIRTRPLIALGGFCEHFVAEDYATAITLRANHGWRAITLPIVTFEAVPSDFPQFARREARWAAQTLQLLKIGIKKPPFLLLLKVISSFNHYLKYPLSLALVLINAFILISNTGYESVLESLGYMTVLAIMFQTKAVLLFLAVVGLDATRILAIMKCQRNPIRSLSSALVIAGTHTACSGPVTAKIVSALIRRKLGFEVTGQSQSNQIIYTQFMALIGCIAYMIFFSILVLEGGFNLIWAVVLVPCLMGPYVIFIYYQRSNYNGD